ncbi:sugar ABC transporter substrate-binding protein [Sorangium sp. So ce295]|uniref:ABC transporter substrate-binding protein n=1 Tax=Sorangium sp. So ce295 TaxID=3133295 RepID=UPI003F5ED09B
MARRALRLVVLCASISPAGCASKADPPSHVARTTITFVGWGMPEERAIMRSALAAFERIHPEIHVEYTQVPGVGYDYLNKLRLMIVAKRAPDVFYVPDGAFGEMVSQGVLRDIDGLVQESRTLDLADIWPTALDRYRWNGRVLHEGSLYALPKDIGPTVLYYNKDVLRRRGVPAPDPEVPMTWDQAIAAFRALTYREGYVQHWGITGYPYEAAVWSAGGEIVDAAQRRWLMDSDVSMDAVQWCADLALRHQVAPNLARSGGAGQSELFEAGLVAMHIDGRWMVPRYRRMRFDWDVAPVPVPKPGMTSVSWSGSVGLAVSAASRRIAEAFTLIEYLAGPEGQSELARSGLQVPNQRSVAATAAFLQPGQRPAHAEVFLRAAETSRPSPETEMPNAFWHEVFSSFIPQVWRGERRARELLPALAPLVEQTMRENNPGPEAAR